MEWYYSYLGTRQGPVSEAHLLNLIRSGQIGHEALVWREGMAEWQALGTVGELAVTVGEGATMDPLSQGAAGPVSPYQAPGSNLNNPVQQPAYQTKVTNGLAIASLVLGVLSIACLGFITAIPAVICGHIARNQIRASNGAQGGEGLALAGLIIGYIVCAFTALIFVLAFAGAFAQTSSF